MIITLRKIKVRPEKRKELSQTLHSIVEQVIKENDCLHSGVYQDVENEEHFLVVEEWATEKKFGRSLAVRHLHGYIGCWKSYARPT